ncbi:MAG: xanthine dehydrogenase family protein subunit M [Betaproteobacteria bacterium]|nr:xanthine dehydrogenase family protein subunit M [Betaproteobacteria bacterium]
MKAPAFAYVKPSTLDAVFELLERHGEGAKLLAGGQSLIPSLNMRLSAPELLIDITGLREYAGIHASVDSVRIGALTTHAEIERSAEIGKHLPLVARAVSHIAHPAIRNRGTLGGSLALADPAAEYPACAVALEATIVVSGRNGERRIKAEQFFKGLFETDLKPGEVVTAAEFPVAGRNDKSVFLELSRRRGDYAIIGLAAHNSRFVFFGAGTKPVLAGNAASKTSLQEARAALATDLDPPADLYNSSATKLHLAGVLLERAWNTLSTSH